MNKNVVSIIIPTFNKAKLAIETFESIAHQSYTHWECIVVDDGSSASEFKLIETFVNSNKKFALYKRPSHTKKGANACRNYGLSMAKGEYIQFFDSDDVMLKNCLQGRVNAIEKLNLDLVVFSMGIFKKGGFVNDTEDVIVNNWESALSAFIGDGRLPWNLQRTLYQSALLKDKLLFNEDLSRFQDVEFNIKLLSRLKPKFKIFKEIDSIYRRASSSNPRSKNFNQNVFNAIPVFIDAIHIEMPPEILAKNKENLQLWLFNLVGLYANNSIKFVTFKHIIHEISEKLCLSKKQKNILKLFFISKTKLHNLKGVIKLNKYLRKKYSEKNY